MENSKAVQRPPLKEGHGFAHALFEFLGIKAKEERGPYGDPQHSYLNEVEDVWMDPGFINQVYEYEDIQVIGGLWIFSIVGSCCSFITLLYISKGSSVLDVILFFFFCAVLREI